MIVEREGVKIGFVGAILESTPTLSNPGPVKFTPLLDTVIARAGDLRRQGADFVVALVHCDKGTGLRLFASRAVELTLMGHTHDLHIDYDQRSALVESSQDALFVVATDIAIAIAGEGAARAVSWRANFRIIDSADVTPDPAMRDMVAV